MNIEGFKVSHKMNLNQEEGAYTLIVDSQRPISQLVMQSKQNLDILQVKNNIGRIDRIQDIHDQSIACLTHIYVEGEHNRLEIKIRTSEGQQGFISLLVFGHGSSSSVNVEVPLKPLNLHKKLQDFNLEIE